MKKQNILLGVLFCALFLFVACGNESYFQVKENDSTDEILEDTQSVEEESETNAFIYVQVCGAVNAPGVFELEENARVFQALEEAGGLRDDADETLLNQAATLTDGQKIYVYTIEEAKELEVKNEASQSDGNGLVNINSATKEELMTLSGIGESKAEAIISYREESGGFSSIEDLKNISGIKDGVYSKIADKICVN